MLRKMSKHFPNISGKRSFPGEDNEKMDFLCTAVSIPAWADNAHSPINQLCDMGLRYR